MVKMFFNVFGQTLKHMFLSAFLRFCTVFAMHLGAGCPTRFLAQKTFAIVKKVAK